MVYEPERLEYVLKHTYRYDFLMPNGIAIESKGFFRPGDQRTILAIRAQGYDLRMLLMYDRLPMVQWCEKHGVPYSIGTKIPKEWYDEI